VQNVFLLLNRTKKNIENGAEINLILNFNFIDIASRYNGVKNNQIDAEFILGIFCQLLNVSSISRAIQSNQDDSHIFFGPMPTPHVLVDFVVLSFLGMAGV